MGQVLPYLQSTENIKIRCFRSSYATFDTVDSEHLLLAILKDTTNLVSEMFHTQGISYNTIRNLVEKRHSAGIRF